MKSLVSFPRYEGYKESGVDWIGDIPVEWETQRLKYILQEVNERSHKGLELLLSVSQYTGVTPRKTTEKESDLALESASLEGYKLVEENDLVSNIMLAWNGSLGFSKYFGIVSPAYAVYRLYKNFYHGYYHYLFITDLYKAEYKRKSTGVIDSRLRLYTESFYSIEGLVPPYSEQKLIATYLDQKTAQIDQAIDIKKKQIELLKERQQVVIQQAVTKGLDPAVRMKDSGIEWIGEVPEHWEVKKLKYLLDEINIRSTTGAEVLLSLSKYHGVIPRNTLEERAGGAESLIGYKHVAKEDLVINKMQAVTGLLAVSKLNGITSPDYSVYRSKNIKILNINYLGYLLSLPEYLGEFKKRVTGVMEGFIRLYTDDLYSISVVLPSVEAQVAIVRFLSDKALEVDKAVALLKKQIHTLQEYKSSLINSAVTGKIKITTDMIAAEG